LLKEVSAFVQKQTTKGFMKSLLMKEARIAQIDSYYRRIEAFVASFQVGSHFNRNITLSVCDRRLSHADFGTYEHA
jgi:hypothetical protein